MAKSKFYEPSSQEYIKFGQALRLERQLAGFGSQKHLGDDIGVSQATVATWENGVNAPPPETVFKVERALGLNPGQLSILLGYLPAGANQPTPTVVTTVIMGDGRLDERGRTALLDLYRTFAKAGSRS